MKNLISLIALLLLPGVATGQTYYLYANAESEDEVVLVRFDGERADVIKTIPVGSWPTEIEGPHGITVAPGGEYWYLTLAHGLPYGKLLKYKTGGDELVGSVELGLYPATMQVSTATSFLYVVNFNLHGDHVPGTVSIVEPESMTEITRTETGIMPHGSRLSADGDRHYSVAMMSDMLYEIDAFTFEVTRTLPVHPHAEMMMMHHGVVSPQAMMHGEETAHETSPEDTTKAMDHGEVNHEEAGAMDHEAMMKPAKPTWAAPHPSKPFVYVANNGLDEIVEVDTDAWKVTRRFATEKAPYNIDIAPNGRLLVVTHKGAASIGVIDLESGDYLAVIPSSRKVTHGVVVSPDNRYAFATAEGIGGEPGSVDVFDLQTLQRVATADIGKQAGGIAFWKME